MTEEVWLTATDPWLLVRQVRNRANDRKMLLVCLAAIKATCPDADPRWLNVVEQYADGRLSRDELRKRYGFDGGYVCIPEEPWEWIESIVDGDDVELPRSNELLLGLIRDIFPFHPITLSPSWLTSTVVSLAQQMYDSRDFSAMPILADALQDASCDNETILTHCRGAGPHVRGCFVIDLLTGRE
jgi:hypothetical protein